MAIWHILRFLCFVPWVLYELSCKAIADERARTEIGQYKAELVAAAVAYAVNWSPEDE